MEKFLITVGPGEKRFNLQQEQFILPEGVTVRDPQGNRFVIEGVLGKGEFGAVYLVGELDNTHNLFALKELINPNKGDRERFAFEGEVLKRLNHKVLPRVHRVFENDKLRRVYCSWIISMDKTWRTYGKSNQESVFLCPWSWC